MAQFVLIIIFFAFFIFAVGCAKTAEISPAETLSGEQPASEAAEIPEETAEAPAETAEVPAEAEGPCAKGWVCVNSELMVYRYANCSFGQKKTCSTYCDNGTCRPAKVCTIGFKCLNADMRGYQMESCSWINREECPFGCEEGKCKAEGNATAAETSAAETETSSASQSYPMLEYGQTATFTAGGTEHTLSIYFIDADKVKVTLDGRNSNWLYVGTSQYFPNGITIVLQEIYFQPYEGGQKAIAYEVK